MRHFCNRVVNYFLHEHTYYCQSLPLLSPERHLKQTSHEIWTEYTHLSRTRKRLASTICDLHLGGLAGREMGHGTFVMTAVRVVFTLYLHYLMIISKSIFNIINKLNVLINFPIKYFSNRLVIMRYCCHYVFWLFNYFCWYAFKSTSSFWA